MLVIKFVSLRNNEFRLHNICIYDIQYFKSYDNFNTLIYVFLFAVE